MKNWMMAAALSGGLVFSSGCRQIGLRTETTVVFDGRTIVQHKYPGPQPGEDDRWDVRICYGRRGPIRRFFHRVFPERDDYIAIAAVTLVRNDIPVVRDVPIIAKGKKVRTERKIVFMRSVDTILFQQGDCKILLPRFRRGVYEYSVKFYLGDLAGNVSVNPETRKPIVLGCIPRVLTFDVTTQRDDFEEVGGHKLVNLPTRFVETGCPSE